MPVGIQRLNARRTQPNPNIIFIKPLPGPDAKIAQNFLERIAAQCLPIMKEHHLSVVTLEEYEPNREFVGRNFNAGEVIQLVLKSARAPHRWLPFRYVQMVMMHELAHCTEMNHSRAFWAVRNGYAAAMAALWARRYTGEGIWGRGAALGSGEWDARNTVAEGEPLPEHLCGGTYRSRRGRRRRGKRKPKLSWKGQKERRIAKKFGVHGVALGADDGEKIRLEGGKKVAGRPRVAGSARGRELRAAAALARFEKGKVEEEEEEEVEEEVVVVDGELPLKREAADVPDDDGDETASGSDYEEEGGEEREDDRKGALDLDGSKMKDKDGRPLVRVCEGEDANDPAAARDELNELRHVLRRPAPAIKTEGGGGGAAGDTPRPVLRIKDEPESSCRGGGTGSDVTPRNDMCVAPSTTSARPLRLHDIPHIRDSVGPQQATTTPPGPSALSPPPPPPPRRTTTTRPLITIRRLPTSPNPAPAPAALTSPPPPPSSSSSTRPKPEEAVPSTSSTATAAAALGVVAATDGPQRRRRRQPAETSAGHCPLCSLANDAAALLCAACANVLQPDAVHGSWRCESASCKDTGYVNAGDCGVCGLCGGRKG